MFFVTCLTFFLLWAVGASIPRAVIVREGQFRNPINNSTVIFRGANIVVKGYPWLPIVSGESYCLDTPTSTCKTFNWADAVHITRDMGWNFIRLGVTWAGAQPKDADYLDADWLIRLHNILDLCEKYHINVLLDVHQDAVGTANCGEGVPQWFSKKATPHLIGVPLEPLPWLDDGACGITNFSAWAEFSGDDDYNVKNPCCLRYNGDSWSHLDYTLQAQKTLWYLFDKNKGQSDYVRYMGLLAASVKNYSVAIGIELMNEPPAIERARMYDTWKACAEAIWAEVPDMAVSVGDTGEAPLPIGNVDLPSSMVDWLKNSEHLFYAWHWYSTPSSPEDAVENAIKLGTSWSMPTLLTEFMSCSVQKLVEASGIGWAYWHYSQYCDTVPFSNGNFGACITGWGAGDSNHTCN